MNTYKNLEIYQLAFTLSIKIYRLNMDLPRHISLKQGNRLRWSSVKIKDIIIEGFTKGNNENDLIRFLIITGTLCNEIILQLKKINTSHYGRKSVHDIIIKYRILKRKIEKNIENIKKRENELALFYGINTRLENRSISPQSPSPEGLGKSIKSTDFDIIVL